MNESTQPPFKFPKSIRQVIYFCAGLITFNTAINTAELFIESPIPRHEVLEVHIEEEHHRDNLEKVYLIQGKDTLLIEGTVIKNNLMLKEAK